MSAQSAVTVKPERPKQPVKTVARAKGRVMQRRWQMDILSIVLAGLLLIAAAAQAKPQTAADGDEAEKTHAERK